MEHQLKWTSVWKSVHLIVLGKYERLNSSTVLLIIVNVATQHGCKGPVVSFYLPIGLYVLRRAVQFENLEHLTYSLKEFR